VNANNSYFRGANYRADLDAVEFAISRQALLDAGWNGITPLNYQVYTTKDGTCDNCVGGNPGAGDVGGHSDIADATMDGARGWDGELNGWFSSEWKVNRAKFAVILHGNQAPAPASDIQALLHRGSGDSATGYFRPLAAHRLFNQPLNLHISGTLASAIEWSASDSNTNLDGRAFNQQIATLIRSNQVSLLPGPFADLMLPHFTGEVAKAAIDAGRTALSAIYQASYPNWWDVLWLPERAVGAPTFKELSSQGLFFTVVDQWTHLFNWFGREAAVGASGYRINEINGMKCFAISKLASDTIFERTDYGLSSTLRGLLHQKAMEGWAADQVVVACRLWEEFQGVTNSLNYDGNLHWIANHPWIQVVTLEDIARGRVDITNDGQGDYWPTVDRGGNLTLTRQAQEYVQYAAAGDFDKWYFGSAGEEESLYDWQPRVEGVTTTAKSFGHMGTPNTLVRDTWTQLKQADGASTIGRLGRLHFYAALFETGFHDEDTYDMTRWSNGAYKYPDATYDALASWAKVAHAQLRHAGIHGLVGAWATNPPASVVAQALDVDQDGELEYLLYNRRVFAVLEDNGGRMVMAFARHPDNQRAYQVIGNSLAYAEGESEDEGSFNVSTNGAPVARRTSALKDLVGGRAGHLPVRERSVQRGPGGPGLAAHLLRRQGAKNHHPGQSGDQPLRGQLRTQRRHQPPVHPQRAESQSLRSGALRAGPSGCHDVQRRRSQPAERQHQRHRGRPSALPGRSRPGGLQRGCHRPAGRVRGPHHAQPDVCAPGGDFRGRQFQLPTRPDRGLQRHRPRRHHQRPGQRR
jgi:hypothetical protein